MRLRAESMLRPFSIIRSFRTVLTIGLLAAGGFNRLPAQEKAQPAKVVSQGSLARGQTARSQLTQGTVHHWTLELRDGEYVEVDLAQLGVDVIVRVLTPGATVLHEVNGSKGWQGSEKTRWVASEGGRWTVSLAPSAYSPAGGYEIHQRTRRKASATDRELMVSDSLARIGLLLSEQVRYADAEPILRRVLEIRDTLLGGEHLDVALALHDLAGLYHRRARYAEAERLARRMIAIRETLLGSDHPLVATGLNILGAIQSTQGAHADAETNYRRALAIREKFLGGDHADVASSLHNLALLYVDQGRRAEAEAFYLRSIAIKEKVLGPEDAEVGRSLTNLARLYDLLNRLTEAEPLYRRALAIGEKALGPDNPEVARTLTLFGWNRRLVGRYQEAEQLTQRGLVIREKGYGPDHPDVGWSLQNLAVFKVDQGRYAEAEQLHLRALPIIEKARGPEHVAVAAALNDLGVVYYYQGRLNEAEAVARRSLAIREKAQDPNLEHSLTNLGGLYLDWGRYAEAEPFLRRSLAITEQAHGVDHPAFANALSNLALLYLYQDRYAEAEPLLHRALSLKEKAHGLEHVQVVYTLNNLAALYLRQGRHAEAEPPYRRVVAIYEKIFGAGSRQAEVALGGLATVHLRQGQFAESEALERRVLAAEEKTNGPASPDVARSLWRLAEITWAGDANSAGVRPLLDRSIDIFDRSSAYPLTRSLAYKLRARVRYAVGDTVGAFADLNESIRTGEELRPQVGGGEENRATFFGGWAEQFELMVAWQLEAGAIERALEYLERGRARVLLDQLAAGKIDLRQSIPTDIRGPLEARETNARARLAEFQQRVARLSSRKDLSETERGRQSALLEDSLGLAEDDFRTIYEEIKNASPLWHDQITSGGRPIDLATIQRRVIPSGGFLLLYQIGDEQSFLFLIPSGTAAPVALPLFIAPDEARALGLNPGALTAATLDEAVGVTTTRGGTVARDSLGPSRLLSRGPSRELGPAAERASLQKLHALWRVLVPEPVWLRLRGAPQVVIVPGRGLHALPFEALVVKPGATAERTRFWLDDGPALRYAASATTLYNVEYRQRVRAIPSAANATVLSLSDPIFDAADLAAQPAEVLQKAARESSDRPVIRSSFVALGGSLSRLPGTAAETDAIREAFAGVPGSVIALQTVNATESKLRPALAGKRYLHLATHGLVDERRGALFAALALTPPLTASAEDDGFLQLHEIYQLRLPELELAVLSACETNLGTTIGSEGVFALSRGFLAAGARRVIASQWAVEDRSTAELMGHFFRDLATAESKGRVIDYAVALRDAKRALRQKTEWAHPYFWAPFILTGAR